MKAKSHHDQVIITLLLLLPYLLHRVTTSCVSDIEASCQVGNFTDSQTNNTLNIFAISDSMYDSICKDETSRELALQSIFCKWDLMLSEKCFSEFKHIAHFAPFDRIRAKNALDYRCQFKDVFMTVAKCKDEHHKEIVECQDAIIEELKNSVNDTKPEDEQLMDFQCDFVYEYNSICLDPDVLLSCPPDFLHEESFALTIALPSYCETGLVHEDDDYSSDNCLEMEQKCYKESEQESLSIEDFLKFENSDVKLYKRICKSNQTIIDYVRELECVREVWRSEACKSEFGLLGDETVDWDLFWQIALESYQYRCKNLDAVLRVTLCVHRDQESFNQCLLTVNDNAENEYVLGNSTKGEYCQALKQSQNDCMNGTIVPSCNDSDLEIERRARAKEIPEGCAVLVQKTIKNTTDYNVTTTPTSSTNLTKYKPNSKQNPTVSVFSGANANKLHGILVFSFDFYHLVALRSFPVSIYFVVCILLI